MKYMARAAKRGICAKGLLARAGAGGGWGGGEGLWDVSVSCYFCN